MNELHESPRILFLYSDTGGGHRSAAEAIIEAIELEYGDTISTEMVDVFKEYAPPPLNKLPDLYPQMVRIPQAWGLGYHLSNGERRTKILNTGAWPYVRRSLRRLIAAHPSDLIVSVHPLVNTAMMRALGNYRPKFFTVVTDLVTAHAFWYSTKVDLCLTPTEAAKRRALECGLSPDKVQVVGLPVADHFCQPVGNKAELRAQYQWPVDRRLILLVGGGEGMGPIEKTALAIAENCPTVALVIVAGRNERLRSRLSTHDWPIPVFTYGFVREMPDFMRAADILVTKAGPGTICEALIAELPMILYSRLPGQEVGNVTYVTEEGAGLWAPTPEEIVAGIRNWLQQPQEYANARAACKRLARPQAARQIAHILRDAIITEQP